MVVVVGLQKSIFSYYAFMLGTTVFDEVWLNSQQGAQPRAGRLSPPSL